jgi:CRP-like cAMP-binding protein
MLAPRSLLADSSDVPVMFHYSRAFYVCFGTLVVVCFGDVVPFNTLETMVLLLALLVGMFLASALISKILALVSKFDPAGSELKEKQDEFEVYARVFGLPKSLSQRVQQHYRLESAITKGVDESELLDDLPRSVKYMLTSYMHFQTLRSLPYFATTEQNLLRKITGLLTMSIVLAGDTVYRQGERAIQFFLLTRGKVVRLASGVDGDSTVPLRYYLAPAMFGDSTFFLDHMLRDRTMLAVTFCELHSIDRALFQEAFSLYPRHLQLMQQTARKEWLLDQRHDHAVEMNFKRSTKLRKMLGDMRRDDRNDAHRAEGLGQAGMATWRSSLLSPGHHLYRIWAVVLFSASLYAVWMTAFRLAFVVPTPIGEPLPMSSASLAFDYFVDILLLANIFFKSFVFSVEEIGFSFSAPEVIKTKHRKSDLVFDLFVVFPWEIFSLTQAPATAAGLMSARFASHLYLRLPKLLLIFAAIGHLTRADPERFLLKYGSSRGFLRLFFFLVLWITCVHLLACLWFITGSNPPPDGVAGMNWIEQDQLGDKPLFVKYTRSLYYIITGMTTVGNETQEIHPP